MNGRVVALVGAQYGSEGKGTIAYHLAQDFDVHIRTGAPNAGHTLLHKGEKYVMRSVPCGFVNEKATLIIGPGALVDLHLLMAEVNTLDKMGWRVSDRLYLDSKAAFIDPVAHHGFEGGVEGFAHQKIGSTGEGVGPARMARIARGTIPGMDWGHIEFALDKMKELNEAKIKICDTSNLVNALYDGGSKVLLEGTQGSGLSLIHGPWPYVTSTDTNAAQLAADAGISPSLVDETILVARTYPIRVAGNSGPLRSETSWEELGFEQERTTVTKKVRRVGHWDDGLVRKAVLLNRPCQIALTFADYLWPEIAGVSDKDEIPDEALVRIYEIESEVGASISMLGTGPDPDGQKYQVVNVR